MQSARTTVLWSEALKRKKRDWRISQKYQNGIPGVQNRISVLWSQGVAKGRISKQRFVDLIATTPAKKLQDL